MAKSTTTHFIAKAETSKSRQKEKNPFYGIDGIREPYMNPRDAIYAYEESFIIGGLVDRIATTAANGWMFDESVSEETKKVIKTIDQEFVFKNLFLIGDVYLEKIRTRWNKLIGFENFLTEEVRVKVEKRDGVKELSYLQISGTEKTPFTHEEIVHLRTSSIKSRYYGDSKLGRCIRQVVLLGFIDKYYEKLFNRGHLRSKIFVDPEGKTSDESLKALQKLLQDRASGLDNAFATLFTKWKLEAIDLDGEVNTEAFLLFRDKLIASIAMALNVPVDIIVPEKASRNTKAESMEELNSNIIVPLQERAIELLQAQLRDDFPDIDGVSIYPVNIKNRLDEMKTQTGYKTSGVLTANEVRTSLWYEPLDGGDVIEVSKNPQDTIQNKIDEEISRLETDLKKYYEQD